MDCVRNIKCLIYLGYIRIIFITSWRNKHYLLFTDLNAHLIAAATGGGPSSISDPNMERPTSLGLRVKYLDSASIFCCGNYLTLLVDIPPAAPPTAAPSPLIQSLNRHFGNSSNGLHYTKGEWK
jgi:hypothetical protein